MAPLETGYSNKAGIERDIPTPHPTMNGTLQELDRTMTDIGEMVSDLGRRVGVNTPGDSSDSTKDPEKPALIGFAGSMNNNAHKIAQRLKDILEWV